MSMFRGNATGTVKEIITANGERIFARPGMELVIQTDETGDEAWIFETTQQDFSVKNRCWNARFLQFIRLVEERE